MPVVFPAGAVFDTAIQIERNGLCFYKKAAESVAQTALRRRLLALARAEGEHMETFMKLKDMLLGSQRKAVQFDPDGKAAAYLRAFAEGGVFNMSTDATQALSAESSMKDILSFAIERERDSILFYVGIREAIPKLHRRGREKIQAIMYEEMAHLALLDMELRKL